MVNGIPTELLQPMSFRGFHRGSTFMKCGLRLGVWYGEGIDHGVKQKLREASKSNLNEHTKNSLN